MPTLVKYTEEFKQQIVSEILSGKISQSEVRRIHNIGGNNTLPRWLKHYGKSVNLPNSNEVQKKKELAMPKPTLEIALERIKELEKQAKDLRNEMNDYRLESLFYKTMVEVAEENHGIEIKKKIGFKLLIDSRAANK